MRIALVTAAHVDPSCTDDVHLDAALAMRGIEPAWIPWCAADVDWSLYDLVLLRSCWDYHRRLEAFRAWLEECGRREVRLANPHAMVAMNMHKGYLLQLQEQALPMPPLRLLPRGSRADIAMLKSEFGGELVLKPAVSASAWRTVRTSRLPDPQAELDALLAECDVIAQRFVPEIERGESSLVFIDGVYSHAVLKRPASGDFRSQREHGGEVSAITPAAELIALAKQALTAFPGALYARVDFVIDSTGPLIMEVELIEPNLYFEFGPGSADRAAEAVIAAANR